MHGDSRVGLLDVLSGVSPDYALVAQKSAPLALMTKFDTPFNAAYGLSLDALAQRYDAQAAQVAQHSMQLDERSSQLEKAVAQFGTQLIQLQTQLDGILGSRSWRITAPMRWLGGAARRVRERLAQFLKSTP